MPLLPDEFPVSVMVDGTTFMGVYGVIDGMVELTSADFGEGAAVLGDELPQAVAERLLRSIVYGEISRTDTPFMRDDRFDLDR